MPMPTEKCLCRTEEIVFVYKAQMRQEKFFTILINGAFCFLLLIGRKFNHRKKKWSERQDLNLRRLAPKASALARLSYAPTLGFTLMIARPLVFWQPCQSQSE